MPALLHSRRTTHGRPAYSAKLAAVSDLETVKKQESVKVAHERKGTVVVGLGPAANMTTLAERLRAGAAVLPDASAIVDAQTNRSRAEFADDAARFAALIARTIPAGRPVALADCADVDFAAAIVGCLIAGVPFVTLDPHDPPQYNAAIKSATGAQVVAERLAVLRRRNDGHVRCSALAEAPNVQAERPRVLTAVPTEHGSIGISAHGCSALHRSFDTLATTLDLQPSDRVLGLTYAGAYAGIRNLLAAQLAGATFVMRSARTPLDEIVRTIVSERITVLCSEAPIVRALAHSQYDLTRSALRVVSVDAESLAMPERAAFMAMLPARCEITAAPAESGAARPGPDKLAVRGRQVERGYLEATLRQCPGVADVAFCVAQGAASPRLIAFVVVAVGTPTLTRAEVRRWMRLRVPLWMIPGDVRFVGGIPRTAGGAPDRQQLLRCAAGPNPQRYFRMHRVPRRDDAAHAAVALWSAVVGTDALLADERWDEAGGDAWQLREIAAQLGERYARHDSQFLSTEMRPSDLLTLLDREQRANDRENRRIVVLLPGLDGDNSRMAAFRSYFAPENDFLVPTYPQWPDIVSRNESLARIIDAVVAQVVAQLHVGPVTLIGYSFGGLIAHEVAGRLSELGFAIRLVAILDCDIMQGPLSQAEATLHSRSRSANLTRDIQVAGFARAVGVRVAFHLARWFKRSRSLRLLGARHRRRLPLPAEVAVPFDDWMTRWAREIAARSWKPRRHATTTIVFRCKQQSSAVALPDLGWSRYTNVIAVKEVGGSHFSMISGAHAGRLARAVQREFVPSD